MAPVLAPDKGKYISQCIINSTASVVHGILFKPNTVIADFTIYGSFPKRNSIIGTHKSLGHKNI